LDEFKGYPTKPGNEKTVSCTLIERLFFLSSGSSGFSLGNGEMERSSREIVSFIFIWLLTERFFPSK